MTDRPDAVEEEDDDELLRLDLPVVDESSALLHLGSLPSDLRTQAASRESGSVGCLSPKWRCFKNLILHAISTFLIFTSFMTFQSLDSTLNASHGLGAISFTVLYAGFILSCVLAPAIVRMTGSRDTMVLCFIFQLVFALSHLYPRFYTLLPSSLLLGLLLGPFWTAQGVYIVALSKNFSDISGVQYETSVSRFYGVFNFFYMSAQKFGNLMESLILGHHHQHGNVTNQSANSCGAAYCSHGIPSSWIRPKQFYVSLLVFAYAAMCFMGIILKAGFVDPVPAVDRTDPDAESNSRPRPLVEQLTALGRLLRDVTPTFTVHCQKRMYLLVPLFLYSGLQQGFIFGDYTKAFVACELGIGQIGYVMLAYGYADALCSLAVGWLERLTGRPALFTVASLLQAALVLFMQFWSVPGAGDPTVWVLYLIPALWGLGDAVWQTTTSSMVGTMFGGSRDAAFACFRMWQAAGLALSFACSHLLCTWVKLYVILGALTPALVAYYTLDLLSRRNPSSIGPQAS